jgi:hypothetical protein
VQAFALATPDALLDLIEVLDLIDLRGRRVAPV